MQAHVAFNLQSGLPYFSLLKFSMHNLIRKLGLHHFRDWPLSCACSFIAFVFKHYWRHFIAEIKVITFLKQFELTNDTPLNIVE